jgi:hypothetical protein
MTFSKYSPYPETIGRESVESVYNSGLDIPQIQREVYIDDQWVTLGQRRSVWLPLEHRATCWASRDSTLVLGHASGRVSFIEFATDYP